jgi:membrane protease YdiL (CAAX protease family)
MPTQGAMLLGGTLKEPAPSSGRVGSIRRDEFRLRTVLVVAVAEEAFYRGVLLQAALLAPAWLVPALVAGSIVLFALAHVAFGWTHVVSKAPLGVLTAGAVLALGTLLPALIAHVWFNYSVVRDIEASGGVSR